MYALIDGNNFYVSCERIFRPDLRDKPVVVLSNNDGCAIARSQEAKDLGIKMGQPYFQIKHFEEKGLVSFSANFILYGDISNRIVNICRRFCKDVEIYSIDESFLDFEGYKHFNLKSHCENLRGFILKGLDIPTSIGIAKTKTLCKIANKIAKKYPLKTKGVYILDTDIKVEKALRWFPIEDVWGIGRRYAEKFKSMGVVSAWDFTQLPIGIIKKEMGIYGLRMLLELKGERQYKVSEADERKKSLSVTRTLSQATKNKDLLEERISTFAFKCSEKLRKHSLCCRYITVFIKTDRFNKNKYYSNSVSIPLLSPTSSAIELSKLANQGLNRIYIEGLLYKKLGVVVSELIPEDERMTSLFDEDLHMKHRPLMRKIDILNLKLGTEKVKLASMDIQNTWKMKQKNLSPRYTTDLNQIIVLKTK